MLSQLKVEGVEECEDEYYVEIQVLDENGVANAFYQWWHGGLPPHRKDGWYEENDYISPDNDNDIELPKGTGLWITAVKGAYLVSSGEVYTGEVTADLQDGFTMVANPYPCTIGLSTVSMEGVEDCEDEYFVEIQMLDENGVADSFYQWWQGGLPPHRKNGWYEENDYIDGENYEIELPAGQGLWVSGFTGYSMKFKFPTSASEE